MSDRRPASNWFYQHGVVDADGTRTKERISVRKATSLETKAVSSLADKFMFFMPYVPLVVCPQAPDVTAEFCDKNNIDLDIVSWDFGRQLVPQFVKAGIDTSKVFGIAKEQAEPFFNFCKGVIVDDPASKQYFRILLNKLQVLTPSNVTGRSAELLVKHSIDVICFAATSATHTYFLSQPPNHFLDLTFCYHESQDKEIASMLRRFRREESDLEWK